MKTLLAALIAFVIFFFTLELLMQLNEDTNAPGQPYQIAKIMKECVILQPARHSRLVQNNIRPVTQNFLGMDAYTPATQGRFYYCVRDNLLNKGVYRGDDYLPVLYPQINSGQYPKNVADLDAMRAKIESSAQKSIADALGKI